MKKPAVIAFLIFTGLCLSANDTSTYKNSIDISVFSTKLEDSSVSLGGYCSSRLRFSRYINNVISAGMYGGFGCYEEYLVERGADFYSYTASEWKFSAQYGLNGQLHVLPLLLKKDISGFDFYISGDAGFISMFTTPHENIFPEKGTYFDYSFSGGASIFLFKKVGLFIEPGYRDYKYYNGFFAKFGLKFRF